jgi:hypothetical protein
MLMSYFFTRIRTHLHHVERTIHTSQAGPELQFNKSWRFSTPWLATSQSMWSHNYLLLCCIDPHCRFHTDACCHSRKEGHRLLALVPNSFAPVATFRYPLLVYLWPLASFVLLSFKNALIVPTFPHNPTHPPKPVPPHRCWRMSSRVRWGTV